MPTLSFVEYLEARLRESPPAQKGERTRERLKIATASMLETKGYHAMRVADITAAAGVAEGLFYVYFADKREASLAVLSGYLTEFVDRQAPLEAVGADFESIRAAGRRWLGLCRANRGLLRCIFQVGDQEADFAGLVHRTTRSWYARVARTLRLARGPARDEETLLLAVYLMGSMMDELVRKTIVFPDREFLKLIRTLGAEDETLVDATSLVWIRTFDPTAKPPRDLAPAAARLARVMWPTAPARAAAVR